MHGNGRADWKSDSGSEKITGDVSGSVERAGLDRTHYSKIERGLRSPTIDTLFKIAHALDLQPHDIMISIEAAVCKQEQKEATGK